MKRMLTRMKNSDRTARREDIGIGLIVVGFLSLMFALQAQHEVDQAQTPASADLSGCGILSCAPSMR